MGNRILFNEKKITPQRETEDFSHIKQDYQDSLVQEKI